ncbi:MAG: hypothetical protein V3U57_04005 [Robiginitomaculum sp.]
MSVWWRGFEIKFEIKNGTVLVKDTGAQLTLDKNLIGDALHWLPFYLRESLRRLVTPSPGYPLQIAYIPAIPRSWYHKAVTAKAAQIVSEAFVHWVKGDGK